MTAPEPTLVNVESTHYPPLLLRHPANPILTRKDWPSSINSVFNAGQPCCRMEPLSCYAASKTGVDCPIFAPRAPETASMDGKLIVNRH